MEQQLLSQFFERYPSALGSSPYGDAYQVICHACGAMVDVAVPTGVLTQIEIRCASCGHDERLAGAQGAEPATVD